MQCDSATFAELTSALLSQGRALRFTAKGFSMQPLVQNGDILMVHPANPRDIWVADAVLFLDDSGRVILHRVIRRKHQDGNWHFWLQGDQACAIDGIIPQAQILGKLTSLERDTFFIQTNQPVYRLLSMLVVLRARCRLGGTIPYVLLSKLIKWLKLFSRYV